jgi:hypothetical protein
VQRVEVPCNVSVIDCSNLSNSSVSVKLRCEEALESDILELSLEVCSIDRRVSSAFHKQTARLALVH